MAIEIIIREDGTVSGTNASQNGNAKAKGSKDEQGKPKDNQSNMNTLLIDYGKQILSEGFNVALDYSGNNIVRDAVSTVTNLAADAMMVVKGGWVGVAAVAMKYATSAIQSQIQLDRERYKVEVLRQQAGLIAEYGGRYTND